MRLPLPAPAEQTYAADATGKNNSRAAGSGKPLRNAECVVYAKKPFGRPQAVLAYLARYTHQVAISNSRLISADQTGVTFK